MLAITYARGERLVLRHTRMYVVLGMLGVFGFNVFFFLGMASTSAVNGALIMGLICCSPASSPGSCWAISPPAGSGWRFRWD